MTDSGLIFGESLHRLMHAYTRAMREAFRARDIDLTVAQVRVLKSVAGNEAPTVQSIATFLMMDRGQITRIVALLRERGLVAQYSDGPDRRVPRLAITEAGLALRDAVLAVQAEAGQAMARDLGADEVTAFITLADRMADNLGDWPPAAHG